MIRVKLLPRRAPLLRLSIAACHLRAVLISQTRPRSFRRRVGLLQNDLSTPSSPSRALIDAAHFPFHCCHGYGLAGMTGIKSSPERRGAPLRASRRRDRPSVLIFCLMETLNLGGPRGVPSAGRDETAILRGSALRPGDAAPRQLADTISLSARHR